LSENGEFPHPGKLFGIWTWKVNSSDPPAQVYEARTQWIDWERAEESGEHLTGKVSSTGWQWREWKRSEKPGKLYVQRISESRPAHVESIAIDFTKAPAVESEVPTEVIDFSNPKRTSSFNGRFKSFTPTNPVHLWDNGIVITSGPDFLPPAFVVDTKTGRKWRMVGASLFFSTMPTPCWSPSANEFLVEVWEPKLAVGLWQWHRETFEFTSVVYLVDMDRQ
jgi:hypothetical protein